MLAFGCVLGLVSCRLLMPNGLEFPGKIDRERERESVKLNLSWRGREMDSFFFSFEKELNYDGGWFFFFFGNIEI